MYNFYDDDVKQSFMSLNVGWHIRDKLWLMPKHGPLLWYFTSTETVRLIRMETQDGHLDFHTALELCIIFITAGCF